jgi:3-methyl-2-oxobutanoate hydroxymethyltransferase
MGHIGLQPQSVEKDGGYKIKGRTEDNIAALFSDAEAVEEAGAFAVVIEGTMEPVAAKLTHHISIPTVGIGASAECDGQILVTDDMVGMTVDRVPKFVKEFANLRGAITDAAARYAAEVRSRTFPGPDHVFTAACGKDKT